MNWIRYGLIWGSFAAFAWRDWEKTKRNLHQDCWCLKIHTRNLLNVANRKTDTGILYLFGITGWLTNSGPQDLSQSIFYVYIHTYTYLFLLSPEPITQNTCAHTYSVTTEHDTEINTHTFWWRFRQTIYYSLFSPT